MLEADPLNGVVQLDVDAEVVRVELQRVAWTDPAIFLDIHQERRDRAVEQEPPVAVALGFGPVIDRRQGAVRLVHDHCS